MAMKTKNTNSVFAENLRLTLEASGKTQGEFAEKLGTTQQTVSRWINGINEPDLTMLVKICKELDETPNSLLGYIEGN